jgi:shikimate kinase
MISGSKIFLVGMPGSGKSTLGSPLAALLGLEFIDLDHEIEINNKSTISELFSAKGEDLFRQFEKEELIKSIHQRPAFLMATGGGTPCFFDNMELMTSTGLVVFLDIPVADLAERLKTKGLDQRPLLNKFDLDALSDELAAKLKLRMPFYDQAHIVLGGKTTPSELKKKIDQFY